MCLLLLEALKRIKAMASSISLASSLFSIKPINDSFLLPQECSPLDSIEPESFGSKLLNSEHRQVLHFGSLSLDTNTFVDVKDSEFQRINKLKITYMYINECVFLMFVFQNYDCMGMLAVEGTCSKMEALLNLNIHPLDLMLAPLQKVTGLKSRSCLEQVLISRSRMLMKELQLTEPVVKRSVS